MSLFSQSPTHPDVVETFVEYCMVITCDQVMICEIVLGLRKKKTQKYSKLALHVDGFP